MGDSDRWDEMVFIGHKSSCSTFVAKRFSTSNFNANKYPRPTKDCLVHLKLIKFEINGGKSRSACLLTKMLRFGCWQKAGDIQKKQKRCQAM